MVYFIGAGAGDPELLTIKGKRLIDHADVIIYAGSLVNPAVFQDRKPEAQVYDSAGMTLEEVLDVMQQAEAAGKTTVRIHTGDPSIYGAIREQLDALFEEVLEQNNVWQQAVQKICSIDLKKEEPGLLLFCAEHGILLETYDAETLRNLDGEFTASAFVSQVTGVDNVCERSAMAGSQNGKILISKMAKNGVTAAFVLDEVKISF